MRGIPNVLWIELKNNLITIFDDLADLGQLRKLCILNFGGCPILGDDKHKLPHLSVLKCVMFSDRYEKYDPVKVACAGYSKVAKAINISSKE